MPPSPDLAPWISHFRFIGGPARSGASPTALRLLTDGCAGVVLDCGPTTPTSPPVFVGVMPTAAVVPVAESRALIGVRFKPGGALPFITSSLHELTGRRVPLPLLWGDLAERMAIAVRSATFSDRVPALEDCLRGRMRQRPSSVAGRRTTTERELALVSQAIGHLGGDTRARVSDVAETLGVGERRLERAFKRAVGVAPKVFQRMRRCCEAARVIRHVSVERSRTTLQRNVAPRSWSAIAFEAGYADQAHFIREFRSLTEVTPAAYAREHHPVGFMQYDGGGAS